MKIERKKITITYRELCFYLYFAIMFGMRMWGIYEGTKFYGILLVVGFLFWGISLIMTDHTVLEYIIIGAFLTLSLIVYLNSREKGLLLYFTLMLGMKGINPKKLFKVGVLVGGTGLIVLSFLASFGLIDDVVYIQSRPYLGIIFRRALGMPHPNTLSSSFVIISIMVMYLIGHKDRMKVWKASVLVIIFALYFYAYSDSRTGIAINVGYLILNLIYMYRKRICVVEKIFLALLFPLIWGISIILPAFASDELIERLMQADSTLLIRIVVGNDYLRHYPITLWGKVLLDGTRAYGIDMSQLYLLLNLGIVAFFVVSALYIWLVLYEIKENQLSELVITFSLLLMGITDPFLYNISFKNICFVFIGTMIYKALDNVSEKLPKWMIFKIQLIGSVDKSLHIKCPLPTLGINNYGVRYGVKQRIMIGLGVFSIPLVISICTYIFTPDPQYALTDRNRNEQYYIGELVGQTYNEKEIKTIKAEGNIVLNYSGEFEPMYIYYSDVNNPIEGGVYAQNAALIEKIRRSISIFFWGTIFLTGIISIVVRNEHIK